MIQIGYYRLRGKFNNQRNYKIYGELTIDSGKIRLRIEERGDIVMSYAMRTTGLAAGRYDLLSHMNNYITWLIEANNIYEFLMSFYNDIKQRYPRFKMVLFDDKLKDLLVLNKL